MTTDTAAVALAEAIDATIGKTYLNDPAAPYSGMAEGIQQYLNSRGIYLQSWNHDMSQAPRDGTVIDVWTEYGRVPNCVVCAQWGRVYAYDAESGHHSRLVYKPTAWCHLMPPPKVGMK